MTMANMLIKRSPCCSGTTTSILFTVSILLLLPKLGVAAVSLPSIPITEGGDIITQSSGSLNSASSPTRSKTRRSLSLHHDDYHTIAAAAATTTAATTTTISSLSTSSPPSLYDMISNDGGGDEGDGFLFQVAVKPKSKQQSELLNSNTSRRKLRQQAVEEEIDKHSSTIQSQQQQQKQQRQTREEDTTATTGNMKKICQPMNVCEMCTTNDYELYPDACNGTGRKQRYDCTTIIVVEGADGSSNEEENADDNSDNLEHEYEIRSCERTEADEEFAMVCVLH